MVVLVFECVVVVLLEGFFCCATVFVVDLFARSVFFFPLLLLTDTVTRPEEEFGGKWYKKSK